MDDGLDEHLAAALGVLRQASEVGRDGDGRHPLGVEHGDERRVEGQHVAVAQGEQLLEDAGQHGDDGVAMEGHVMRVTSGAIDVLLVLLVHRHHTGEEGGGQRRALHHSRATASNHTRAISADTTAGRGGRGRCGRRRGDGGGGGGHGRGASDGERDKRVRLHLLLHDLRPQMRHMQGGVNRRRGTKGAVDGAGRARGLHFCPRWLLAFLRLLPLLHRLTSSGVGSVVLLRSMV